MTTSRRWLARLGWALLTLLSTLVGLVAAAVVASGFDLVPGDVAANAFITPLGLRVHIVGAAVALLLGPWQFLAGLRRRAPVLHRVSGRLYVAGCVVGGAAGAAIGPTSTHGLVAGSGFLVLGLLWCATTVVAVRAAVRRDLVAHRRWMVRSFALTFAAVTLRLYLGVGQSVGLDYDTIYPAVAWLSWIPNLLAVEWWLRREPGRRASQVATTGTGLPSAA